MRLSEFILTYRAQILSEWVAFARTCLHSTNNLDLAMLRDHASEMLEVIAADLNTPQSNSEQADKSKGKSDADLDSATPDTAAQSHGSGRAESGFSVEQMVSEYRALRASVIRLWIERTGALTRADLEDLVRFNEAIDQALAESTSRFTEDLSQSKEMFLAMLGHDLRTPLGAIMGSAQVLAKTTQPPEIVLKMASIVLSSGKRMSALISDLLDFTRSRLGSGIPIVRDDLDIAEASKQTVDEIAAMHPQRAVNFEIAGDLQGQWDSARVSQALSNVVSNAVQHGSDETPINVSIRGADDEVVLEVHNRGPVIPASQLNKIFDPMHRIDVDKPVAPRTNLGLGLYIAERIVAGHGGRITVESSEDRGTTFAIHLPRRMRAKVSGRE
jgi:signal transduction histidine kinase